MGNAWWQKENNESSIQAIIRETSEETPYLITETSLKFITKKYVLVKQTIWLMFI